MRSPTRRRLAALAPVTALAIGAVWIGPMTAQGEGSASALAGVPAYVALEDSAGSTRVAVYDAVHQPVGTPVTLQVDPRTCEVSNAKAVAGVLDIEVLGTSRPLQLVSSRLGVRQTGGPCGGNAARVASGESMRITVGSDLAAQGYAFAGADLNIDTSQGNGLLVSLDGGIATTNQLVQNRLQVSETEFESITLSLAGQGSFSLRSAGGPVGDRTTFDLVDLGILVDCGQSVTVPGDASIASVTFTRLDNKYDAACARVPLRITFDREVPAGHDEEVDVVTIDVPDADGEGGLVRAVTTITWNVQRFEGEGESRTPRAQHELNDELTREVLYPGLGPDGKDRLELVTYCEAVENEQLDITDITTGISLVDQEVQSGSHGSQPWCLLADDRTLADDGDVIVQVITLVANGDPKFF